MWTTISSVNTFKNSNKTILSIHSWTVTRPHPQCPGREGMLSRQGRDAFKDDKPTRPSKRLMSLSWQLEVTVFITPLSISQHKQETLIPHAYSLIRHWFLLSAIIIPQRPQPACGLMLNHFLLIKDMYRAPWFLRRAVLSWYIYIRPKEQFPAEAAVFT